MVQNNLSFPSKLLRELKDEHIKKMAKEKEIISFSKFICDILRERKK